jgi:hypothetical protein
LSGIRRPPCAHSQGVYTDPSRSGSGNHAQFVEFLSKRVDATLVQCGPPDMGPPINQPLRSALPEFDSEIFLPTPGGPACWLTRSYDCRDTEMVITAVASTTGDTCDEDNVSIQRSTSRLCARGLRVVDTSANARCLRQRDYDSPRVPLPAQGKMVCHVPGAPAWARTRARAALPRTVAFVWRATPYLGPP